MRRHRGPLVAGLLALAVFGAVGWWAAGDGARAGDGRSHARSRYIAAVDAVCADATRLTENEAAPGTPAEEVAELRRAARLMASTLGRIERIRPPAGDAEPLRREFLEPSRRLVTRLETLAGRAESDLRAGRTAAARRAVEESLAANPVEEGMRAFTEDYGFVTCSGL